MLLDRCETFKVFHISFVVRYPVVHQWEVLVLRMMGAKPSRTARCNFKMSSFVSEFVQEHVLRVKLCNITLLHDSDVFYTH